jgi:hypothetical protein
MSLFGFDSTILQERRSSPRFELHYLAQLDIGFDALPINCIICNISANGAKLTVGTHDVPDEFMLVFKRRCRVVRRTEGQVGVKFVQA